MEFHHHGYVSTDPRELPAAGVGVDRSDELPEQMDVLIVGAGPAGMITAAQLSMFPTVTTCLIDRRDGRLKIGHADGVQARSVETFQAFGFANKIAEEAYRITETSFWKADPDHPENIIRAARTLDDPTGISEFPHLIVNQARILDCFRDYMANSPSRMQPNWGYDCTGLEVGEGEYPVTVHLVRTAGEDAGAELTVKAKYVLGADGAHSKVRKAIGAQHVGGVSKHAWGVMDILVNTDFPDIRTKCIIQATSGSILHIPREGGYLFRSYVDLGEVSDDDAGAVRKTPIEEIIGKCNEILRPYSIDVKQVCWWSVYEVGHRVTDRFDDVPVEQAGQRAPHVFIAGDACHTHSAKAGQGMNVSMQDGFNLAWKLGHVLTGLAPASLLSTYSAERQTIAQNLIDFDREWSSRMAGGRLGVTDDTSIEDFYVKTAEFPAGFMTEYQPSVLVGDRRHQGLAAGFPVGKRFKSAAVTRLADATPVHLGHLHQADGRWRIYAFADGLPAGADSPLAKWAAFMGGDASPIARFTPTDAERDSVFDVKVVYQQPHPAIDINRVPAVFKPACGPFGLANWNKVFSSHVHDELGQLHGDIFNLRGVSRSGAVVVVRPDMYVAQVLPLEATDELTDFFAGVLNEQGPAAS